MDTPVAVPRPAAEVQPAAAQFELGLDLARRRRAAEEAEEDELLLCVEPRLVLVPPAGAEELPTIDPFGDDSGPANSAQSRAEPVRADRDGGARRGLGPVPAEAEAENWTVQRIARRA